MTRLFAAAVMAVATGATANAGILPIAVTVTPEADNFRWTYAIVLPTVVIGFWRHRHRDG